MASKGAKKGASSNRVSSATPREAASIAASAGGPDSKRPKALIWPEWSEKEVNEEKWDVLHKGKGGKEDKGKSPVATVHFDDPEGKIDLPSSLRVDQQNWKRPSEFILDKTPVVVAEPEGLTAFDLVSANEHLHHSELMRYIISQIVALWEMSVEKNDNSDQCDVSQPYEENLHTWRPWEHIYALSKVQKPPFVTVYNPYGKYVVRLYWMGCWRKIIVDDLMPFDENDNLLLPATTLQHELWPMLLTKALIKVASLDYTGGSQSSEFGDCSIIHSLTGWIPEAIPLQGFLTSDSAPTPGVNSLPSAGCGRASPLLTARQVLDKYFHLSAHPSSDIAAMPHGTAHRIKSAYKGPKEGVRYGHISEVWELLKGSLPEWKLPLQEWEKQQLEQQELDKKDDGTQSEIAKENASEKDAVSKGDKAEKADSKSGKDGGKDKGGKDAKDKDKGKDKDKKDKDKDKGQKDKEKSTLEDSPIPDNPEVVVFGTYWSTPKYPVKVSVLGEMADASEKLRQNGLSHIYPHPVCITQTRSCPLEPPPPPEKIPAWKLIRPRKKKATPSDEPQSEPQPPKPIQCIEITSPFVNYKVSPVPIPTETHRPKSSLERGGTRSRPDTATHPIEESDENAPEPDPNQKKEDEELGIKEDIPKPEDTAQNELETSSKPSSPVGKEKRSKSISKPKDGKEAKDSRESPKQKRGSSAKGEKPKSAERVDSGSKKSKDEKKDCAESPTGSPVPPPGTPPAPTNLSSDSGLAPPPPADPNAPGAEGEGQEGEEHKDDGQVTEDTSKAKKVWMDFEEFCKCFKTLYIYHKPETYKYKQKQSDLKGGGFDERAPTYLFVDNLKPTEIVVCFSSLSRWHDPPPLGLEEAKSHTNIKGGKGKGDPEKELTTVTSSSVLEGSIVGEPKPPPVVNPGTLVAEPYSWKSLVTGQPILRLRSTGTRAAVLSLPPGRHVLRFMMSGPLGYAVHLCSTVPFVFGNEEEVMPELTKESCRFVDNALQVMTSIGKCINLFNDGEGFKQAWEELVNYHCPYRKDKTMSKQHHFEIFNAALYNTLKKHLAEIASPEIAFAWRCFTYDSTTKNILGLPTSSRPGTATTSHRGSAKPGGGKDKDKKEDKSKQAQTEDTADKADNPWANREPLPIEQMSAVKIQKNWKGFYVRKIEQARTPGTPENVKVMEALQKSWSVLEQNTEQSGLFLFRYLFKLDPDIMAKYPFYQDEWNKISYHDYSGTYPDQPPNTWFLVFREVFYVTEEMLAVPKLYVPVNTCLLRVVNNDTGEEIPRVFQKVAPYVYKKNKKGYTFVAEARAVDVGIPSNRWRMRLIGSLSPLPSPAKPDIVNCSFAARPAITDYYIPNPKDVIFRYSVKVTEDHLASVQVNTSKQDVYIKLVILDNEVEVASTQGKGHAVIPSFIFLKDLDPNEEKRPSSRTSVKGKGSKETVGGKGKRSSSAKSPEGRLSRSSSRHSETSEPDLEEKDFKPHKYIVQATVLKNSWPLSESSWAFVQMLRELEKNELKVVNKERPPSAPKQEKTQASSSSKDKGKGAKGKDKGKDKDGKGGSRPPSQQFDNSKPHWTLRVVSDAAAENDIEVKKDTERADEIRALKRAWEAAEEGRAVKAQQSRLKYLNTHMVKLNPDKEEGEGKEGEEKEGEEVPPPPQTPLSLHEAGDETLTLEPPPPPTPQEYLQPMDLSPFVRRTLPEPRYLDEEELRRREEEQKQQIEEYKAFRDRVKAWREKDKQERNMMKIKQLEQCEELQAMLDAAREAVNAPREAIRQRFLEAERKRLEDAEAAEAAEKAALESKSPKGKKNSAKGKKSPNGKKKK